MNARNNNRYPSTKFAFLSDGESIANARKNYFIWIITVTILFFIAVAYFSYKYFISPIYFTEQKLQSFNNNNNTYLIIHEQSNFTLKSYSPGPLLTELKKRNQKDAFTYDESRTGLETIPAIFIEQILQRDFENLQDFINLDLLLLYKNLISKFDVKTLKRIFNEYQHKLLSLEKSEDFVDFITSLKSNRFKFYANILSQDKHNLELEDFESFFALTEEFNHWYNYINYLSAFLASYEQQKLREYLVNCTEGNFERFTQETQKRLFYFAYPFKITEKKLEEINGIINTWSKPVTTEFYNCSMVLYRKVLLLSDINEEIQRLNASCLKYVYLFASSIIYLDADLEFFGVNFAIVAPEWVFLKKVKINLSGITGMEFANETASLYKHGLPGNPGGHAGDFIGVGNLYEKFLIISADGGKGGNGQNGAKGPDGIHYTRPGPPINRPTCVSKINAYNNAFGQKITHYKVFSPFGCGVPGTDGGVGGVGGEGGVITLISDSIKITKGPKGVTGTPGRGGAGGIGGQNGCFYEVLDVDDETLHPITRVKCPKENTLPSGCYGKDNHNTEGQIFSPDKENLTVHNTLYRFLIFAGQDFVEKNDPSLISFLKNLNQLDLQNETNVKDIVNEYKLVEVLDRIEIYEIFREKILKYMEQNPDDNIQLILKYLESIILEKIMILKENVNFFIIDFKYYLNLIERDIKTTNEQTRELESVSYFVRKVYIKIEELKKNLNTIKMKSSILKSNVNSIAKSSEEFFSGNNSKYFPEDGKILNFVTTTIDVLRVLLNPVFGDTKQIAFNNLLKLLQGNTSDSSPRTNHGINSKFSTKSPLKNAKIILLDILENFRNNNTEEIRRNLSKLRDAIGSLKQSVGLSKEIRSLLDTLADEVEHFSALYIFLDWEELEVSFFKSLKTLKKISNLDLGDDEEVKFLKTRLVDGMITLQCKLAMQTTQLNLHSFRNIPTCHQLLQNKTITSVVRNLSQNIECEDTELFCKNHFKAVFDKNSAVGEFYFWPNAEIRDKLKILFSGGGIKLKSDLINSHVFDKNFIQFRSLKLELESGNMSQTYLKEILSSFKIQMIHSGYSYYNWKGETYIFVSEKVNLEYSFRVQGNNDPEVYNSLYKKCQEGEIKLSPYTTWTLRLISIKDKIDFIKLMPFAESVNLRLIGTGTYIS